MKIRVTPGKTQSKAGFVVGIIFCLIGLVVVISTFGPFGILWTAAAGWATYVSRMKQLQSLYDQALISREEYEEKRKEILQGL